jgi:hypothetical protein
VFVVVDPDLGLNLDIAGSAGGQGFAGIDMLAERVPLMGRTITRDIADS